MESKWRKIRELRLVNLREAHNKEINSSFGGNVKQIANVLPPLGINRWQHQQQQLSDVNIYVEGGWKREIDPWQRRSSGHSLCILYFNVSKRFSTDETKQKSRWIDDVRAQIRRLGCIHVVMPRSLFFPGLRYTDIYKRDAGRGPTQNFWVVPFPLLAMKSRVDKYWFRGFERRERSLPTPSDIFFFLLLCSLPADAGCCDEYRSVDCTCLFRLCVRVCLGFPATQLLLQNSLLMSCYNNVYYRRTIERPQLQLRNVGRPRQPVAEGCGRSEFWLHVQAVDHRQQQRRQDIIPLSLRRWLLHIGLRFNRRNRFQSQDRLPSRQAGQTSDLGKSRRSLLNFFFCCHNIQHLGLHLKRTRQGRNGTGRSRQLTTAELWDSCWCTTSPTKNLSTAFKTGELFFLFSFCLLVWITHFCSAGAPKSRLILGITLKSSWSETNATWKTSASSPTRGVSSWLTNSAWSFSKLQPRRTSTSR